MSDYLQMPWSIEDTINHLNCIRDSLIRQLRKVNLDGKAEQDVTELNYDFDRAIKALEENKQYRQIGTLEERRKAREKQNKAKVSVHISDHDIKIGNVIFEKGIRVYKCLCGSWVTKTEKFCHTCGQALNWEEEV